MDHYFQMQQRGSAEEPTLEAYTGKKLCELMSWVDRPITETA